MSKSVIDEIKDYCDKHRIQVQIYSFPKDKHRFEVALDNFTADELSDVRRIIMNYGIDIEDDTYLAGNGRSIVFHENKSDIKSLKESHGFDEKIVTVNHHDYLLQGGDFSTNRYKVSIIPDYNIFEDGIACECFVDCYDYGDKASLPYRNKIGVHYKVWITPSGKTKGKLVLDEEELMDKEDFDYIDDSVFVMICEWIDNRYGKELFESKKTTKRSLKESNYDLINDDLLAMCKGSTKQLIYAIDDYQSNYSDKSLKELKRRIEEVEDLCNKILYQINKR